MNYSNFATPKDKYILITNAYPHEDQLYRNGFIHRRVKAYQEKGIDVEVFVLHGAFKNYEEYNFDNVNVMRGQKSDLYVTLGNGEYKKILIHFVSTDMIDTIIDVASDIPVIVWVHGFEAEAWHRRWFNFLNSKEELKRILKMKDTFYANQLKLMNWLYLTNELNLQFVHVSKWFKEHIAECDARAVSQNASIIPNIIDNKLFRYNKKDSNQRYKILSIRPFASHKYANDQSVDAVLELSKRPIFDRLEFAFFGEGKFFDKTLLPLRNFDNVSINKTFLNQNEIADLHKSYGVFLCPTRLDSQGVSMCEAMSSGLVPLSSNITAIPEFVEHNHSGLLANPEDPVDIADNIERLFFNESLFQNLSQNASESINDKCSQEVVINKELELILS
ncbi:glycosyltransferase family 4 protein [Gracilibacillus massiliensis]|uniref:glycosyltransferase family 4 protein n=1 Tax=Gracilibacillus massiliensis TaxID=1564956 RepID=UPI00071D2F31|nr:glycosyltransferase family 4 protein [Gracilibacillus massiliensis]